MKPEFDIIKLAYYQEQLFQLDLEICSLSSIARRIISKKTSIPPEALIKEGLRLLDEIDILCNEFYMQYLKVNN